MANLANILVVAPTHLYGGVTLPVAPQALPPDVQIADALLFKSRITTRFRKSTGPNAPPQLPANINATLLRLEAGVTRINRRLRRLDQISAKLDRVDGRVTQLSVRDAVIRNSAMAVDDNGPFVQVPFANGDNPWGKRIEDGQAMFRLPHLIDMQAVNALTGPQATAYCRGYNPDVRVPRAILERRRAIAHAIGLRV